MTDKNIYIVQALGFGDDEDAFYNCSAHSTYALAEAAIEALKADDAEAYEDADFVYKIEEVIFVS